MTLQGVSRQVIGLVACSRHLPNNDLELAIMPLYEIAFVVAVALFAALGFMQNTMRRQVHHARFGNTEISPWDVRYSNTLLGQYGIWKAHKRAYARRGVRSSFVTVCVALLVSIILGVWNLLYLRYGP